MLAQATFLKQEQRRNPGELGVWVFVLADMFVFTMLFCLFLHYRNEDVFSFNESMKKLNLHYGMINTVILLFSSWFAANAAMAMHKSSLRACKRFMLLTMLCGLSFLVLKGFEYSEKLSYGITPYSNEFFMFYYVLRGIHLLHVIIGIFVVGFAWIRLKVVGGEGIGSVGIENAVTYWHMVDLLWIILFPLLYLLPLS